MYYQTTVDIDECHEGSHDCDQVCTNLVGSYECSCETSFVFDRNSRSCVPSCGGNFSTLTSSFQSPGWPDYYPELDFSCQWLVQMPEEDSYVIRFTTDDTAYGILGRDGCPTDYVAFYDGVTAEAPTLGRFCYLDPPPDILTSSGRAMVVFQSSSRRHPPSRRGVRVSFEAILLGIVHSICIHAYMHMLYVHVQWYNNTYPMHLHVHGIYV